MVFFTLVLIRIRSIKLRGLHCREPINAKTEFFLNYGIYVTYNEFQTIFGDNCMNQCSGSGSKSVSLYDSRIRIR